MRATSSLVPTRSNSSILYKFSTGFSTLAKINTQHLQPDDSDVCISHSIHDKIQELMSKAALLNHEDVHVTTEQEQPYYHLVSTKESPSVICKLKLSWFFLELVELVKINYLKNSLETESNSVLFVNAASLAESVEFMGLYRNNASFNVYATPLYGDKNNSQALNGRNTMEFIFVNHVDRMDYHAVIHMIQTHQKDEGTLIIKTSNLFYKQSVELIHVLNSMYSQMVFIQPGISPGMRGNVFIVCKNKKRETKVVAVSEATKVVAVSEATKVVAVSEDAVKENSLARWPVYLLNRVEDMNIYFGKRQLENIQQYIEKKHKCDSMNASALVDGNKSKCIQWCNNFQVPCHPFVQSNIGVYK